MMIQSRFLNQAHWGMWVWGPRPEGGGVYCELLWSLHTSSVLKDMLKMRTDFSGSCGTGPSSLWFVSLGPGTVLCCTSMCDHYRPLLGTGNLDRTP